MSIPFGLVPGDLIVFAQSGAIGGVYADHNIGRIELVREKHCTAVPWRPGDRTWGRSQHRVDRRKVVAVLPRDADVTRIADELNVLRNQREMERASAKVRYEKRVSEKLAAASARAVL